MVDCFMYMASLINYLHTFPLAAWPPRMALSFSSDFSSPNPSFLVGPKINVSTSTKPLLMVPVGSDHYLLWTLEICHLPVLVHGHFLPCILPVYFVYLFCISYQITSFLRVLHHLNREIRWLEWCPPCSVYLMDVDKCMYKHQNI